MKMYAYLILAVLVASIVIQPLTEVALVCKDRIEIGSAITNSVRAAKKECYTYLSVRDLNAEADREVFADTFSEIFAQSLDLRCTRSDSGSMTFRPNNTNKYNNFTVDCSFVERYSGGRIQTDIVVTSETPYKFKTKYLQEAQALIESSGRYMLKHTRRFNLKMTN